MVAKKDFNAPHHSALKSVPNLHVIKALQSLKSRGYVKEQFAWRHYYWYLTNSGIQYLRDYLHLPPEIVPPTLKRASKPAEPSRQQRNTFADEKEPSQKETSDSYRRGPGLLEGGAPRGFGRGKPVVAEAE